MADTKFINVYSHSFFELKCQELNVDDYNVEKYNIAFIDIIGTPDCLKYYLEEEDTKHWFKENHSNVLNLEFDDISQEEIEWEGHLIKGFSDKQAKKTFQFIEDNIDKNFQICCRAGFSRSQAVGNFIYNFYKGQFDSDTLLTHPNMFVYRKLSKEYYKKYGTPFENKEEIKA